MQELVILLSSIAGAASAVAVKKFPKNTARLQNMGASSHIKNQINSLKIEKDMLNKTIARLYEGGSDLSKIQKDQLILKYQHQLGIILAKLEKLEAAKQHPDLGPVGDGLITLMDQKLSQLDNRLYELSSKITNVGSTARWKKESEIAVKPEKTEPGKKTHDTTEFENILKNPVIQKSENTGLQGGESGPMEITTLTNIPKNIGKTLFEKEDKDQPDIAYISKSQEPGTNKKENLQNNPPVLISDPKEIQKTDPGKNEDNDSADLETIKKNILKRLNELEQAEV